MTIKMTPEKKARFQKMYNAGKSYAEIAKALGVSWYCVKYHVQRGKHVTRRRPINDKRTPAMMKQLGLLHDAGLSYGAIGRALDLGPQTIYGYLKRLGRVVPGRRGKR